MGEGRMGGERGAIAIFVSLVLLGVGLPLAGLGYSAYVRGATAAEFQRAADSGALAGASAIPLGDLSAVNAYLADVGLSIPLLPSSPPADPRVIACKQAVRAALVDSGFSRSYATPTPDGTTKPACAAEYLADGGVLGTLSDCVSQVASPLTGLPFPDLKAALARALPALLKPGIKVTLTSAVRGPLDALNPADDGTAKVQQVQGAARRRFKNVVVIPTVGTTLLGAGTTIDLNPAVGALSTTLNSLLAGIDGLVAPVLGTLGLPGCDGVFGALTSDLADIINPVDADGPSASQVLEAAVADAEPVLLLRKSSEPFLVNLLTVLNVPFLDFVPVCVTTGFLGTVRNLTDTTGCMVNAPGLFRATLVKT